MQLPEAKFISRRNRGCPLPDTTPAIGVALSLFCLFLLTANFRGPSKGIVSIEELPHAVSTPCLHDAPQVFIGLDSKGRFSFAISESSLQAAVIKQVSIKHGIVFSNSQVAKLKNLSFLATTVEQLSASLLTSASASLDFAATQPDYLLSEAQLAECAKTAKLAAPSVLGEPVYFSLLIHTQAPTSKVMRLLALLQAEGINRFNLQTRN